MFPVPPSFWWLLSSLVLLRLGTYDLNLPSCKGGFPTLCGPVSEVLCRLSGDEILKDSLTRDKLLACKHGFHIL